MPEQKVKIDKSIVLSYYSQGGYLPHGRDANFKANEFLSLFYQILNKYNFKFKTFVDVGCGSGDFIKIVSDKIKQKGFNNIDFKGYDIAPKAKEIVFEGVDYIYGDFCETTEVVDVVTLFDVFEHIPDTIDFIKNVAKRAKIICCNIPLDYSFNFAFRNKFKYCIHNPGHLIFLDTTLALNLLNFSGLKVIDYKYIFGFMSPSGSSSLKSKIIYPFRYILSKISPWLLSKTFGGASLLVITLTPNGLSIEN